MKGISLVAVAVLLVTIAIITIGAYFYMEGVKEKPVLIHETTTTTVTTIPESTMTTSTTIKEGVYSGGRIEY